jgi:hypothetical protein
MTLVDKLFEAERAKHLPAIANFRSEWCIRNGKLTALDPTDRVLFAQVGLAEKL